MQQLLAHARSSLQVLGATPCAALGPMHMGPAVQLVPGFSAAAASPAGFGSFGALSAAPSRAFASSTYDEED